MKRALKSSKKSKLRPGATLQSKRRGRAACFFVAEHGSELANELIELVTSYCLFLYFVVAVLLIVE